MYENVCAIVDSDHIVFERTAPTIQDGHGDGTDSFGQRRVAIPALVVIGLDDESHQHSHRGIAVSLLRSPGHGDTEVKRDVEVSTESTGIGSHSAHAVPLRAQAAVLAATVSGVRRAQSSRRSEPASGCRRSTFQPPTSRLTTRATSACTCGTRKSWQLLLQELRNLYLGPSILYFHRRRSALDEREQIGVDRLRLRGGHSVGKALVGLQRPVLQ